ncbi:MAG: hypothetical protein HC852_01745 [Acaryochloridaceae cyanobacterium RU_4_10]|nr:hypothetical protein [Acaryochloridaceae cyanobacterium RU_4_10]
MMHEDGRSLVEVLEQLGYTTSPAPNEFGLEQRHILEDSEIVFTGSAQDVWEWLYDTGLIEEDWLGAG